MGDIIPKTMFNMSKVELSLKCSVRNYLWLIYFQIFLG